MSVRALVIGLLGAIFIATVGYFNDQIPRLNHFVGNQFPIAVFFPLIFVAAAANPLLRRLRPSWRLSRAEMAMMLALLLVACNIPGSGLLRMFSRNVALPIMFNRNNVSWQKTGALAYAPRCLLAGDGQYDEEFLNGVATGMRSEDAPIAFDEVPWHKWQKPLTIWLPIVVLFAVASVCLALMIHRTWAEHDRLPYPVAQLAGSLMGTDGESGPGPIFRRKHFLVGAILVFVIHVVNGLDTWYEGRLIRIPMEFNVWQIANEFKLWGVPWGGNAVCHIRLWPTVIAFACFVASDVSLSLGISAIAWTFAGLLVLRAGGRLDWATGRGGFLPWQTGGSCIAIGLMLLYTGRRFYGLLLRRALGLGASREVKRHEMWACRFFLLSMGGLVGILMSLGVAWPIAILAVLLFMLGYLVIARINAESGMFLIQSQWQPVSLLVGVFGAEVLGLHMVAALGMLCVVFSYDRRECLLPLMLNGLRVCDLTKVRSAQAARTGLVVFVIALAAAIPFSLWVDHNFGLFRGEGWSTWAAPSYTFNHVAQQHTELKLSGMLHEADRLSPLGRITNMNPSTACLVAMGLGAGIVILLSALRLRYTWWPIHPILLVVWGTWAMYETAYAFLIGWAIKKGSGAFGVRHATLKTFMIGVIAGDLLGGLLWMIVGAVYWGVTGQNPPRYHVFPGG